MVRKQPLLADAETLLMKIAVQESVNVCVGQNRRIRRHAEYGNAVTGLDVHLDQPLKHAFDEGIDRPAASAATIRSTVTRVAKAACGVILAKD